MASRIATPVVVSSDERRHEPMLDGAVFPVGAIPVSGDKSNLLQATDDGLFIAGDGIISKTAGNALSEGADGGLMLDATALVSPGDKVLTIAGNLITGRLDLRYDASTARLSLLGVNNAVVATVQLPVSAGIFTAAEVLEDYTPDGGVTGTYIHFQFETTDGKTKDLYINVSDLVDTYNAGDGVAIENNIIAVRVSPGGVLGYDSDGSLLVAVDALVSADAGNSISVGSDGKLFSGAAPGVTADALGPGLKLEDGKVTLDLADNMVVDADGKVSVNTEALSETLAVGVSSDAGNILMEGSDGRAFLPNDLGSL